LITGLSVGSHVISATYGGDNNYTGGSSGIISQVVVINPLIVTKTTDDGSSGTLRYALLQAVGGDIITFDLPLPAVIALTSNLIIPALPGGLIIQGESVNGLPQIIIDGSAIPDFPRRYILMGWSLLSASNFITLRLMSMEALISPGLMRLVQLPKFGPN
jgi:hypothetical protein